MIRIVRASDTANTTSLLIGLDAAYPLTGITWFEHRCASMVERNLLEVHLHQQLYAHLSAIRACYYRMGWRQKASKSCPKKTCFPEWSALQEWEKADGRP